MSGANGNHEDLRRIDELHRVDAEASRAGDFRTLRTLMSDDAVVLPPGGRMLRGADALDEAFGRMAGTPPATEVLDYGFEWHEVEVCGRHAFEWGYITGRERTIATGEVHASRHHVMRILRREPDGAWKVHRTIWNDAAQ